MKFDTKVFSYVTLGLNILASIWLFLTNAPLLLVLFLANALLITLYLVEDKK